MAGYDPNQPRNKDGEWTIAGSSEWKAAGLKTEYGYQLRYITFDTKSGEMLGQWWNDFCRCSLCRYPTLSPEEGTYSNCSTCGVEYKDD